MEPLSMLASSRFLLKKQASKKFSRWKIIWKELFFKALSKFGIIQFFQHFFAFLLTTATLVPLLVYIKLFYSSIRKLICWKIERDHLHKHPNSSKPQIVSEFCNNDGFAIEGLRTYVFIADGLCDFSALKNDFETNFVSDQMKMRLSFKLGVPFWEMDPDFSMERHFILSSGRRKNREVIQEHNLTKYLSEVKTDQNSLPVGQAPWQLIVIPFEYTQSYALVFYVHPLLAKSHPAISKLSRNKFLSQEFQSGPIPRLEDVALKLKNSTDTLLHLLRNCKQALSCWNAFPDLNGKRVERLNLRLKRILYILISVICVPRVLLFEFYQSSCLTNNANPFKIKKPFWYPKKHAKRKTIEVAWSEPVSEDLLETIARDSKRSVQDVLMSCCSGALHSYLGKYVCISPEDVTASVSVPFSPFQTKAQGASSEISFKMASGMSDSRNRLDKTSWRRRFIEKNWLKFLLAGFMIDSQTLIAFLPGFMVSAIMRLYHRKHALSLAQNETNAEVVRQLFGKNVSRVFYWTDHHSKIGLHISLITHNGHVTLCVRSNTTVAPEPQMLTTGFVREVKELASWFGVHKPKTPNSSPRSFSRITRYPQFN